MTPRFHLADNDLIMIGDVEHQLVSRSEGGVLLRETGKPDRVHEYSHEEFGTLFKRPDVRFSRGYYGETASRLRLQTDQRLLAAAPEDQRRLALWKATWCDVALYSMTKGTLRRTEASVSAHMTALEAEVAQREARDQNRVGKPRVGMRISKGIAPSPKTLLRWIVRYERGGCSPLALFRRRRQSRLISAEPHETREKLLGKCVLLYHDRNRPTMEMIVKQTVDAFRSTNEERVRKGLVFLQTPSASTIRRRIRTLDPYATCVQRYGADAARKKFRPYFNGVSTLMPLERVEMDEWRIDLMTILEEAGAFDDAPGTLRDQFCVGRRWLYAAIDVTTRCIVSMRLCETPNPADAIRALELITIDKSGISDAAGCESRWSQYGGIGSIVTDQGAAFISGDFKTAVTDLGTSIEHAPAGLAEMRATIERVFRTYSIELMPWFTGRTFSNVVERGDYPSMALAVFSDDELTEILLRYVVDCYHNSPHGGLGGETPQTPGRGLQPIQG